MKIMHWCVITIDREPFATTVMRAYSQGRHERGVELVWRAAECGVRIDLHRLRSESGITYAVGVAS